MKALNNFFKKFEDLMDGFGDAIDESVKEMETEINTQSGYTSNISNLNGNVVITGNIKSLKVNGKVIDLSK